MTPRFLRNLFAFALVALFCAGAAQAAESLRLAVQKTGTTGWELAVVAALKLDKEAGLDLAVTELASPDAGKIAIQGGSADIIVSDWLWVARQRAQGARLTFYPSSSGIGAVMTRSASGKNVRPLADRVKGLVGKKLGVAGGPVDKSWLLLKAYALKIGVDLEKSATIVYGAPPLIAEKLAQGELDAALEFWNFAVDLEARGFARAVDLAEVEKALGATGDAIVTGFVFDEGFASAHRDALKRFFAMMKKAKELIATNDKAWEAASARIGAKDTATLDLYRKRYVAGVPKRTVSEDEADAAALYGVLALTGGEQLVGPGKALDAGTFYKGGDADR